MSFYRESMVKYSYMNLFRKIFRKKILLVTHDQGFHADDVMAYAILQEILTQKNQSWKLLRTRDEELQKQADIIFDTGNVYDPEKNIYDHHQTGRAGARENGVLYASAGLIWKHYGRQLCSCDDIWQSIDRCLIQEFDASDSGQNYIGPLLFTDSGYTSLGIHIANFGPDGDESHTPEILLERFEQAAAFARGILTRMIHSRESLEKAFQEVKIIYENSVDKQILVFDKNYDRPIWKRIAEFPEPFYAVYPNMKGTGWKVEAIPVTPIVMESRKLLPESWRGLHDQELQQVTAIADAEFCHPSGFLVGATTKQSALKLAEKALNS